MGVGGDVEAGRPLEKRFGSRLELDREVWEEGFDSFDLSGCECYCSIIRVKNIKWIYNRLETHTNKSPVDFICSLPKIDNLTLACCSAAIALCVSRRATSTSRAASANVFARNFFFCAAALAKASSFPLTTMIRLLIAFFSVMSLCSSMLSRTTSAENISVVRKPRDQISGKEISLLLTVPVLRWYWWRRRRIHHITEMLNDKG